LTTWHYILSTEITKITHSFILFFGDFSHWVTVVLIKKKRVYYNILRNGRFPYEIMFPTLKKKSKGCIAHSDSSNITHISIFQRWRVRKTLLLFFNYLCDVIILVDTTQTIRKIVVDRRREIAVRLQGENQIVEISRI